LTGVADENEPDRPEDEPPPNASDPDAPKPGDGETPPEDARAHAETPEDADTTTPPSSAADPGDEWTVLQQDLPTEPASAGLTEPPSPVEAIEEQAEPVSFEAQADDIERAPVAAVEYAIEPPPFDRPEHQLFTREPTPSVEPELVAEPQPEPIIAASEPEPELIAAEPEEVQALVEVESEPEPVAEIAPEPEPSAQAATEPELESPSVAAIEPVVEPEPPAEAAAPEPEPVYEPEPAPEPEPTYEPEPPAIAARSEEPVTTPESEPEAQPIDLPAAAAASASELPNNYFRAAGDPDEPPPEPDTSFKGQVKARWEKLREQAKPHVDRALGQTQAVASEVARHAGNIKPPRNVRETAIWGGWLAGGFVAFVLGFFVFVTWGMPSTDDLWEARSGQSITFQDRNGNVILREGAQNAPPVDLASLPPYVGEAFIAIEDRRFYDHLGVDVGGMMRAAAENLRSGRVVQGGSTITQQLAKNLFLTNERSWRRKAQEIAMAIWLEGRFTKEEILALYLSRVYFGAGAYGIEAAAERYFDRPARELTLLQSAMLAGLVKAPSRMNPARQDMSAARERAEVVLQEMVNEGHISDAERQAALSEELVVSRRNPAGVLGYYRDWIDPILNEIIGQQRDDFIIETTIDIAAQRAGAEAIESVLAAQGESRRVGQAGLVGIDADGGVRSMVGGRDYDVSQFNRVTQARRQPGSSFKFFIYLAAMENGFTPWTVREDAPITIRIAGQPDWSPGNYEDEYHGPSELARAFAASYNMVAIRVANEVGGQNVIDVARRLGVQSPLNNYHSLALGAQEITLMEMTQAYAVMANEGRAVQAHGITRIRRASNGEVVWSFRPESRAILIEDRPRRYMNYMMARVVNAGTGTAARISGREIGGKTGTGNDYRDAWFVGFTPGFAAGVWVGNDNFTETARVTGGSLPAEIWARYANVALRGVPAQSLDMPGPDDYGLGTAVAAAPTDAVVGAPVGVAIGETHEAPEDDEDRSLDFGPEG
jgi:penicillin-binding protein 1A